MMSVDADWNPDRYLFDFPDIYYQGPLVDAPVTFKVFKVGEFCFTFLKDSVKCVHAGLELHGLLAGLAAIDYVAGFHVGRETKHKDYVLFMRRFFPRRYEPHLEQIYGGLRCGLMHNLVPLNPWRDDGLPFLITGISTDHLVVRDERLVFNVLGFLEDVRRAWVMYSHMVVMTPELEPECQKLFQKRFDRLAGAGAFMVKVPD